MYLEAQLRQAGGLLVVPAAQLIGPALRLLRCALLEDCTRPASDGIRQVQGGFSPHQNTSGCFSPHQVRSPWLDSCHHLCAVRTVLQLVFIIYTALRYFSHTKAAALGHPHPLCEQLEASS